MPDGLDLLPEDGDYSAPLQPGIETIELPTIEETAEEAQALTSQQGVTPLTSLPDDTSFLDTSSEEEFLELDGMPLEDMPLIEPDTSDLDIIIDSAFGNDDEELPAFEAANEELEPEIVLDIDSNDNPVVSTVDAFPEPLEELEDALDLEEFLEPEDLGGLELHSEETDVGELEELSLDEGEESLELIDDSELMEPYAESVSTPSMPITYHPDELSTSLDDSLFVESTLDELEEVPDEESEKDVEPEFNAPEVDLEDITAIESVPEVEAEVEADDDTQTQVAIEPSKQGIQGQTSDTTETTSAGGQVPDKLKHDVKSVLLYLDQLLASLPEEKIEEFASSEYYDTYKRLFDDLGLL